MGKDDLLLFFLVTSFKCRFPLALLSKFCSSRVIDTTKTKSASAYLKDFFSFLDELRISIRGGVCLLVRLSVGHAFVRKLKTGKTGQNENVKRI